MRRPRIPLRVAASVSAFILCYLILQYGASQTVAFNPFLSFGVPGTAAVVLFLLLGRLRGSRETNIALALLSACVALYAAELAFRAFTWARDSRAEYHPQCAAVEPARRRAMCNAATTTGYSFDTRAGLDILRDLERQGVNAWPSVAAGEVRVELDGRRIYPLGGIANVTTVYCNESGEWVTYESDEYGFPNPRGLYERGELTIALVGDSFAKGYCVDLDESAAALIRSKYPRTLNVGVDDSGPLAQLAVIREFVAPFQPRVLIWFFFEGNDLLDLEQEMHNDLRLQYLQDDFSEGLIDLKPGLDQLMKALLKREGVAEGARENGEPRRRLTWRAHPLFGFASLRSIRHAMAASRSLRMRQSTQFPFDRDAFRSVLRSAKRAMASGGGRMYFVYLPSWERYSGSATVNPHRDEILHIVRDLGLPIIDLHDAFAAHDDPLELFPFRLWGHYAEAGYRLVAETVLQALEQDGIQAMRLSRRPHSSTPDGGTE
jgi:hypothetical protein